MALLISKVEKHLVIPPKMRGLPNEQELIIDLPAEIPVEVPHYIANYYIQNYPHVYRLSGDPKPEDVQTDNQGTTIQFNPLEFLEQNYSRIEEALKPLDKRELLAVAKALKLNGAHMQTEDRIRERVLQDIKVKNEQQEELDKHKGITTDE